MARQELPRRSPHSFHIAVMGIGFTLDTPVAVSRYGIGSAVSLVDDILLEQVRQQWLTRLGEDVEPIPAEADDGRARRVEAYLRLLGREAARAFEALRDGPFDAPDGIARYVALLPEGAPLKAAYAEALATPPGPERRAREVAVRAALVPGAVEANIMSKLDRAHDGRGHPRPADQSDAVAALRGFIASDIEGSLVLSAGLNPRLVGIMASSESFFPTADASPRQRLVLKVSDYRSALIQGRLLARRGLWIDELRVESGLNCGGHTFPTEGLLLGPILEDLRARREELVATLFKAYRKAMAGRGLPEPAAPELRITVQGGLGTHQEDELMRTRYGVDGTGWGTPFLMVPEVTRVTNDTRRRLAEAGPDDIRLTWGSPLGVPFWSLASSTSEMARRRRVDDERPGSPCPKRFLALNPEFGEVPLCTASRGYQRRKLAQLPTVAPDQQAAFQDRVLAPCCICHDLGADIKACLDIEQGAPSAICPGPSARYFKEELTLDALVDHIYGRRDVLAGVSRPHQLLEELGLYLEHFEAELAAVGTVHGRPAAGDFAPVIDNLRAGVTHLRALAEHLGDDAASFSTRLATEERRLDALARAVYHPGDAMDAVAGAQRDAAAGM